MRIDEIISTHRRLGLENSYINRTWCILTDANVLSYSKEDEREYSSIIPTDLSPLLLTHLDLNLPLDPIFLNVFVYHVLTENYNQTNKIVAADLFFITMKDSVDDIIEQSAFSKIFSKICNEVLFEMPFAMMQRFQEFILSTPYDLNEYVETIISYVRDTVISNDEGRLYDLHVGNKSLRLCLVILNTLLEREELNMSNTFTVILNSMFYQKPTKISMNNLIVMFREVLLKHKSRPWFKNILLRAFIQINSPELTVKLMKVLDQDDYEVFANGIINEYVTCEKRERSFFVETMSTIISDPYRHDNYDDRSKQKLIERIVNQVFLRLGNCDLDEKEEIMKKFIRWYELKDINLRRALQKIFNADSGAVTALNLFSVLESSVDLYWNRESYNVNFINLTLNMFCNKQEFICNYNVRVVEMLCLKGSAIQIRQCLPYMVKVIQKYGNKKDALLKPLIGVMVNFALVPSQAGKFFLLEIYGLIKIAWEKHHDADVEFSVLNVLLTDDMRCVELFNLLSTVSNINDNHIKVLLEERTLKYKKIAWRFLSLLLDKFEYSVIPDYFLHHLPEELRRGEFYLKEEAIYVFQTIAKIYQIKIANKSVDEPSTDLARQLLEVLSENVKTLTVPSHCILDVVNLIYVLNKIIKEDKLENFRKLILSDVLNGKLFGVHASRKLNYLAIFLIPYKMNLTKEECATLRKLLERDDLNSLVLSKFVLFYGRVCLKYANELKGSAGTFKKFLSSPNPEVQINALMAMHDIYKVHLQNVETLVPDLLKLINSSSKDVKSASLRLLLELVGRNHVRLHTEGYLTVLLAIIKRDSTSDVFLRDKREREQLTKGEKIIKGSFVQLVFYLNGFNENKDFMINLPVQRKSFSYEYRCVVYRYVYRILQRQDQLYVLSILCNEFVKPLYNGVIETNIVTLATLRDCVVLISLFASDNFNGVNDSKKFYETFMPKLQKLQVQDCNVKCSENEFNKQLEIVIYSLLKILSKIEKIDNEMMPGIYNAIALLTTAYYDNFVSIANENKKIRQLYCVFSTFYTKYQNLIRAEPLCIKTIADKEEWRQYTRMEL